MSIIAIIADTHMGSTVALSVPQFVDYEGREIGCNKTQLWINDCWRDYWYYVRRMAEGKRLIVLHLGDVIEGIHHNSPQALQMLSDQKQIAKTILEPVRKAASRMFFCRGTEVHAGLVGEYETDIAREMDIECDFGYYLNIDGVTLDIAHQGRAAQRDWTSSAAGVAAQVQLDYYRSGSIPPRYVVRAHHHRIDDSGDKIAATRAIVCPAWQTKTAFGHKIGSLTRADIGGLVIDTDNPEFVDFSRARYRAQETVKELVIV